MADGAGDLTGIQGGAEIVTFGCRLNIYESEVMRAHAAAAGLGNAVIINTCAVTAEAERQALKAIRRARRERPGARVIVTGCAAQIKPDMFAAMDEVDHVLGNDAKLRAESFRALATEAPRLLLNDMASLRETAGHLMAIPAALTSKPGTPKPRAFAGQARAYLQVQNGCDHRCTFCIIPYGRGPSRSVPLETIAAETRKLVEAGWQELVLTGVDLTSYGQDLPGRPRLGAMVRELLRRVPELPRLRLSSLDPAEIDADLWQALATEPRLMPHLHLSVQAGDDLILKRMKRRHLREDVIRTAQRAREVRPDVALGADLIAGFPTETEAMFARTMELVDEAHLSWLHVFPYSPRAGTPAAKMPQVPPAIRKERALRLRRKGEAAACALLESQIGQTHIVLVEQPGLGRTPHYAPVTLGPQAVFGTLAAVRIDGASSTHLQGTLL